MLNFAGPKATEKEIASHINALMMAGVITTSTFLSGVLYYLMNNVEAFDKLKTELRTTFSSLEEITCNSTAQCEYLAAVIKEGLRIYPPAGGAHLPRIVPPEGAMISGYWVPGRVSFDLNMQRLEAYISDRLGFRCINGLLCTTRSTSTGRMTSSPSVGSRVKRRPRWATGLRQVSRSRMAQEAALARSM